VRLLLDTHVLIWWFTDDPRLPDNISSILDDADNSIFVSAVSAWEVTTKYRKGHLPEAAELAENFLRLVVDWHFTPLPITVEHGHRAGMLPGTHKDPFDRMLAAQAIVEDMGLVTVDTALAGLGARVVW
jgi:PIN domain nuclease of toxin-antitoxin system